MTGNSLLCIEQGLIRLMIDQLPSSFNENINPFIEKPYTGDNDFPDKEDNENKEENKNEKEGDSQSIVDSQLSFNSLISSKSLLLPQIEESLNSNPPNIISPPPKLLELYV
jgi:hypothetical protein